MRKLHYWAISLIVLVTGIFLFTSFSDNADIGGDRAGDLAASFVNENLLQMEDSAETINVSEKSGVYNAEIEIRQPGTDEAELFDVYLTKDGKYFFPAGHSLEPSQEIYPERPDSEDVYQEEPDEIPSNVESFVSCLSEQGFKIYGAERCPFCGDLVDKFGGYDVAEPIYVECTEQEELCEEKGITAYPTIFLKEQEYEGMWSLEAFARETECVLEY